MMKYFDYVYYKSCKLYAQRRPDSAGISGLSIIAGLQLSNLLTSFFIACLILERKLPINKLIVLLVYVLLLILNGLRYNKLTFAILDERWQSEVEKKKIRHQLLVLLYGVLSLVSCIGLAIYLGSKYSGGN